MKYYPIHIIIKDVSFWIVLFLCEKFMRHGDFLFQTGWWTAKEIVGTSFYMSIGTIIINLLIFTGIYLLLSRKRKQIKSFWFGIALHLFSLIVIWTNVELVDRGLNLIIASGISLLVSGYVYKKLNSGVSLEQRIRKCFGVQ
jgi:hypothetical protein